MSDSQPTIPAEAIVVGIDGSERDRACINYAVGASARSGHPIHLLFADPSEQERDVLVHAVALARELGATGDVSSSSPPEKADRALVEASEGAHLVVVGASPAGGGLQRLLLGHSALNVAMHASSDVVLIPETARVASDGPIVVGVDGSDPSRAAAARAFAVAQTRKAPLTVVSTWYLEVVDGMVVTTPDSPGWDQVESRVRAVAEDVVAPLTAAHPDVPVEIRVVRGPAAKTLMEQADGADLLVLGNRGNGGFRGMTLGSVALKSLENATCPVMIVRHE